MSGQFTPGPWAPEFGEAYNVRAPEGGIVAQIHHLRGRHGMGGRIGGDEAAANARLIAAAPDLLAALQRLVGACDGCATFDNGVTDSTGTINEGAVYGWQAVADARAAIKAATGEQA